MTPVLCGFETFKIIDVVISPVVAFMVDVIALGNGTERLGRPSLVQNQSN